MNYATMCSEPVRDIEPAQFEPIPVVMDKAITSLGEAISCMKAIYRLVFGEEPNVKDVPKCENMTQSAEHLAIKANEIRQAVKALAERLGA